MTRKSLIPGALIIAKNRITVKFILQSLFISYSENFGFFFRVHKVIEIIVRQIVVKKSFKDKTCAFTWMELQMFPIVPN